MAPTVCLSELPISRSSSTSPYCRRRQRTIGKHQRLEQRHSSSVSSGNGTSSSSSTSSSVTPPGSPYWELECPNDSCCTPIVMSSSSPSTSAKVPTDLDARWKMFLARREGLLGIIVRTMALVRRNHILQRRVNALRAETREFIRSVLNNPENKLRQQRFDASRAKDAIVSSSTEEEDDVMIIESPQPPSPDSTSNFSNNVTSTALSSDWESEEDTSSLSDESQASNCSM